MGMSPALREGIFLALSSCVNTCPGSALPLKTPEGAYKCISGDGEYTPSNVTDVAKQPTSSASLLAKNGHVFFVIMGLIIARFAKK